MRRAFFGVAGLWLAAALGTAYAGEDGQDPPTIKRRHNLSDEDLRKQLLNVPEVGLNQPAAAALYEEMKAAKKADKDGTDSLPSDAGGQFYLKLTRSINRPDMFMMPWRTGADSQIGRDSAERLHALSIKLRTMLRESVPKDDVRPDPKKVRAGLLASDEWTRPAALPTLLQMLMAENGDTRPVLIEVLSGIKGKDASIALAQRALFDLSPEIREKAVQALARRPAAEYQHILLVGMRWPWPAVADHAAEAIAALELKALAPEVLQLLRDQDPRLPYPRTATDSTLVVRDVVRVNHMCNCVLCHAPSQSKEDLVRGFVPVPGQDPPPLYYAERTGMFIRADITYVRQEFSVVQPVANSGKWPGNQRFDYVLRTRKATREEIKQYTQLVKDRKLPTASTPYTEAALFTLRQLTRMDAGTTYDDWAPVVQKFQKSLRAEKDQ